jgi:hypothetical protein
MVWRKIKADVGEAGRWHDNHHTFITGLAESAEAIGTVVGRWSAYFARVTLILAFAVTFCSRFVGNASGLC